MAKTIQYDLSKLKNDLNQLMVELVECPKKELGWIESSFVRVKYSDPKATKEIRESTKNLSIVLTVLYMVVVTEQYFPATYSWTDPNDNIEKQRNLWEEVRDQGWLTDDELLRLRAYRHIRHTFAHSHEGNRAKQHYKDFDTVMNSKNPIAGINPDMWDANKITVSCGACIRMVDEIKPIIQNILNRMSSS